MDLYLKHRWRTDFDSPAIFLTAEGKRMRRDSLEHSLRQILTELRIYKPRRRQDRTIYGSTNMHSFRHSFAVRTLERWHSEGQDVEALLPLLSFYMGHIQVSYTSTYLHLTPKLRQLANKSFASMVLNHLDQALEVDEDE